MCAHAVRVVVKKIPGVDSVRVSLNEGSARIWLRHQNTVSIERLREAIRSNGFTPKAAEVQVMGMIVEADSGIGIAFGSSGLDLVLTEHRSAPDLISQLESLRGSRVTIEGTIPQTRTGEAKLPTLAVWRYGRAAR